VAGGGATALGAKAALAAWSAAPDGEGETALRRAALMWGTVMIAAVAAILVDTWRLTGEHRPLARTKAPT
jgi:hypothetical protein